MKYLLLKITWGATMLVLVAWIAYTGITMPIVTLSHSAWLEADYLADEHASDRELILASCVRVTPITAGTCENPPRRHGTIWSQ